MKRSGHNAIAKCPFHSDSSPSLYIYPNNYHCFACSAHGNIIDFEMNHKNISFREAVVTLGALYQIDIVIENEDKSTSYQKQNAKLLSHAEELHKFLKNQFSQLAASPIKSWLENYFLEVGYLESTDQLANWNLNTQTEGKSFYTLPFQTERGDVFGFVFIQLEMGSGLDIPYVKNQFTISLSDHFQRVVYFPQARRHMADKDIIITTDIFDLFFLLKRGIKNSIFVQEIDISTKLYSYLAKFVSKLYLILPENSKNTLCKHTNVSIFVRWTQNKLQEKIEFYRTLTEKNILHWISGAQKIKAKERIVEKSKQNTPNATPLKNEINLLQKSTDFYHRILLHPSSTSVIEYLKSRDLTMKDIETWKLGFCPKDSILTRSIIKQKGDISLFVDLGLLRVSQRTKEYYDFFYGRLIIPILNHSGKCVALGGRILEDTNHAPKYINSSESALFSKSKILFNFFAAANSIVEKGYVVVVEGYMDCITLVKHGITNTVAVMGTALTSDHLASLAKITQRVILCFDTDSAGQNAVRKSFLSNFKIPQLILETIELSEKDPDEFVKKHGAENFLNIIKNQSRPVYMRVTQWIQQNSIDTEEFIENLKSEFKYAEFTSQSLLWDHFKDFLMETYNINIYQIFVKNAVAVSSSAASMQALQATKTFIEHNIPIWTIQDAVELKILFAFFLCDFSDLPKKLYDILNCQDSEFKSLHEDCFKQTYTNQISDHGKSIFYELFQYCTQKKYKSCAELREEELISFTEPVKIFVAYMQKFVSTLVSHNLDFLLDFKDSSKIFNCENVWSPQNSAFLRLQRRNVELAHQYNRLVHILVECWAELEIIEIDAQLAQYSKTHFDHDIKEKFNHLMQERATRRLLLMG